MFEALSIDSASMGRDVHSEFTSLFTVFVHRIKKQTLNNFNNFSYSEEITVVEYWHQTVVYGTSTCSIRSAVVDEERVRQGLWLRPVH